MSARNIIHEAPSSRSGGGAGRKFAGDALAGLTLAAIAVPEQMATARLAHLPPEMGFLAFLAGTFGFLLFGASRVVSVGADSTIAPIFAASLALIAASGSPHYAALAALLAVMTGALVAAAGVLRMGWISNLLSAPVTAGFLAGISAHIIASQIPVVLGVPTAAGGAFAGLAHLNWAHSNPYPVMLGAATFLLTLLAERFDRRWPGALLGVAVATVATLVFGLERHGVQVLGVVPAPVLHAPASWPDANDIARLAPLSFLLALIVMVQSAATSQSFSAGGEDPRIDRDFAGVGAANILAGLAGAFPVNASPPRTAVTVEAGAQTKAAGTIAAVAVALVAILGSGLLKHVPHAALAGLLLFVAFRIIRIGVARDAWRESKPEFLLIVATALAIIVFPIEIGVGAGILLSLLHGMWTTTRAQVIALARVPGTSVWWPATSGIPVEQSKDALVLAFQAPLSFLNATTFRRGVEEAVSRAPSSVRLVVLEANNIVEIDFTAAHVLKDLVLRCRKAGVQFAVARLESVRAQRSFRKFGVTDTVGDAYVYRSVSEAVDALAPEARSTGGPPV